MFWKSKKQIDQETKEAEQRRKVISSQLALLESCNTTVDVAAYVTTQLKKNLEDAIKQFETTMKIINDALLICDENGTIRALNPATERIFSCYFRDLITKNVKVLFKTESDENFWDELEKDTVKGFRQNGEIFSIDVKIEKMVKSDNSLVYLILVHDLTQINTIRKNSQEFEHRYRVLFDQCVDGIAVIQNGEIVASNCATNSLIKDVVKISDIKLQNGETIEVNDTSGNIEFILSGANIIWNDKPASLITIKDIRGLRPLDTKSNNTNFDMIVCFDKNFIITFVNEPFCNYYQKLKADLIGFDIRKILNQTELAAFLVSINSLSSRLPFKKIQVHVEKNGKMVLQDWLDSASFENDEIVEYQRTGRDITDVLSNLK